MTPEESMSVVALVIAAHPVPAWEPETAQLYCLEIREYDYTVAMDAIRDWRRTRNERPSIAELRKTIAETAWKQRQAALARADRRALPPPPAQMKETIAEFVADLSRKLGTLPPISGSDTASEAEPLLDDEGVIQERVRRRERLREQAERLKG